MLKSRNNSGNKNKSIIYNDNYISFIKNLINARNELGLSRYEVCRMLSKDKNFLYKIENCMHKLDAYTFWILAKIYKKPLDYFFQNIESDLTELLKDL